MPAKGIIVATAASALNRWRTVDIVVTAVRAAFGIIFWAWNTFWVLRGDRRTGQPRSDPALAQTGALHPFPSGRERLAVRRT